MTNRFRCLAIALVSLWFGTSQKTVAQQRDYFPGGAQFYGYTVAQGRENFANVRRAQSEYSLYPNHRTWIDHRPGKGGGMFMLSSYYLLHVRWELKDGRQFIAEKIDVRAIMGEYFKNNNIQLPWQKEGRPMATSGDSYPNLAFEIKDEYIILKWNIETNHTPVDQRFTASGAATPWYSTDEDYVVAVIKGTPTNAIDFDLRYAKPK